MNPWKVIAGLDPATETWWGSSPLVWPSFREAFLEGRPEAGRDWYAQELDFLFAPALL